MSVVVVVVVVVFFGCGIVRFPKLAGVVGVGAVDCDQLVDAAAETTNARRS